MFGMLLAPSKALLPSAGRLQARLRPISTPGLVPVQRLPLVRRAAGGHHGAGGAGSEPGLGSADPRIEHSHTQRYAEAGAGAAVAETAAQQQYDAAAEQAQAVEEAEYSMQTLEAAAVARPPAPQQAVQASGPLGAARQAMQSSPLVALAAYVALGFLGVTFLITLVRMGLKYSSADARRGRTINKNKLVVDELRQYLPDNRAGLTGAVASKLRFQTGFTSVEVFRKYLWYLLRERKFDGEAVADLVALKAALKLSDEEVAEALRERAQRIYEKYGNVMLETEGMTKAGIERKATTRALYSKLQYLLDDEGLLAPKAAEAVSLRDIFGATEQDAARLRIVSLHDTDLDAAFALPAVEGSEQQQPGETGIPQVEQSPPGQQQQQGEQ